MVFYFLAINPGATSTKIAWFEDENKKWQETIYHPQQELDAFSSVADQFEYRMNCIKKTISEKGEDITKLSAVVGRGGLLDPIPSGTYKVTEGMIKDLKRGKPWEHASNLGGIIAKAIADELGIPAFVVDPVAVDEMDDVARITGLPELPKRSLAHSLNIKAVVRKAAKDLGKDWRELNFVVAHLGSGISVCAHRKGKMVDVNNANEFGPFSPERAGGLPAGDLVKLCFSGKYTLKELRKRLAGNGGVKAYLGTSDMREVKRMIENGDKKADLIYRAMAYQVAKEIGAYAVVTAGNVDAIILTGGIAYDEGFVNMVRERVQWIAPVLVYPGEDEMQALAEGALRVLRGEEEPKIYEESKKKIDIYD